MALAPVSTVEPSATHPLPTAPSLVGRPFQDELDDMAAMTMVSMCLAVGAMQFLSGVVGFLLAGGANSNLDLARLAGGALLLAVAGLGLLLSKRGRLGAATLLMLLVTIATTVMHTLISGFGVRGLVLPAFSLLVALMGALLGVARSLQLLLVFLLMVGGLSAAEVWGLLDSGAAAAARPAQSVAAGLIMMGVSAAVLAAALHRLLQRNLLRAREEQQRLATLLRVGSDWTWQADERGRFNQVSPSIETHTGTSVTDFMTLGQAGGLQWLSSDDHESLQEALRSRKPFRDLHLAYRRRDGQPVHVRLNGEPIADRQDQLCGWWGMGRNISDEVLRERRAQGVRDMLDRLFRMAPDATCVMRMDSGQVLFANPAFLTFCGRSESEVLGRSGRELGLWLRNDDDLDIAGALRQGGGVLRDWRTEAVRADGQRRTTLVTGAAFDWNDLPVMMLSVRDVTAVERARQQADAILDTASIGIALVRRHKFVRVNPAFATIARRDVKDLVGQPTWTVFPNRARFDRYAALHQAALARGETVAFEFELGRHNGHARVLRMLGRAIDVQRFEESGALWLVEDITQARIAERELAHARRQAESANRAKSAFLAQMSHEIRTPLNGVVGLARLLDAEANPGRRGQYIKHLIESAQSLSGLVSDVLDLSKIEAGRMVLEQVEFDLHEVVRTAFRAFAALGDERGLELRCEIDTAVARQRIGDPVRVRQIVSNYLGNALKFTQRGRVGVRVTAAGPERVRVEVQDTGIGIDAAAQAVLFQPFAQADSSTTRRFGGSGLGLSICRELAGLMGGQVGMQSEPDRGSLFWAELTLPLSQAPETALPPLAERPLAGLRVLVAEDNEVNRLIARGMLERLGAEVHLAADGSQAVGMALAAQPAFDAVLMDLHMPVQDGLSAARALRANPMTAHLSLIAWTAAVLEQERQDARAAGMNEFVAKPVFEADLLRVLAPLAHTKPNRDEPPRKRPVIDAA